MNEEEVKRTHVHIHTFAHQTRLYKKQVYICVWQCACVYVCMLLQCIYLFMCVDICCVFCFVMCVCSVCCALYLLFCACGCALYVEREVVTYNFVTRTSQYNYRALDCSLPLLLVGRECLGALHMYTRPQICTQIFLVPPIHLNKPNHDTYNHTTIQPTNHTTV